MVKGKKKQLEKQFVFYEGTDSGHRADPEHTQTSLSPHTGNTSLQSSVFNKEDIELYAKFCFK